MATSTKGASVTRRLLYRRSPLSCLPLCPHLSTSSPVAGDGILTHLSAYVSAHTYSSLGSVTPAWGTLGGHHGTRITCTARTARTARTALRIQRPHLSAQQCGQQEPVLGDNDRGHSPVLQPVPPVQHLTSTACTASPVRAAVWAAGARAWWQPRRERASG